MATRRRLVGIQPLVGGSLFWVFDAPIIWRWDDPIGLPGLFGFGPKMSGFVVQKRNETPDTLTVDVRIAF